MRASRRWGTLCRYYVYEQRTCTASSRVFRLWRWLCASFFFPFLFLFTFFPIAIRFRVCTRHVGGRARPENFPIRSVLGVIQYCPCFDSEAFEGCRRR